jgi:hypothetical protein
MLESNIARSIRLPSDASPKVSATHAWNREAFDVARSRHAFMLGGCERSTVL